MGRCRGRSKEQPKNTPISLHDRRLQHPKECSIPVALCPPAIVRLFLSGYLFLSPPLSQSFLSFSFSLSFPPFFSSSSLSSSSSSLSSSSCSSSHSIGTERDTKRDDVKSAGGTITKPFFVPPRSTLSSSIPLSPSFSLSLLVKPCQGITIHRFGGTRTRGIAVVERASVNGSIARL